MLSTIETGNGPVSVVLMHFFGSSKHEWTECMAMLAPRFRCIAMDLPGFGDSADVEGYGVAEMVDSVQKTLESLGLNQFVLVGHSMSGKIALAIAARKFAGLLGVILVTPSPPSPEPIPDDGRTRMLAMKRDRKSAESFLDGITARPLKGELRERAIRDFMRSSPEAWRAWLEAGSREDWTQEVGTVDCPALVITGTADPSLDAPVQKRTTMTHLSDGRLVIIPDCGHAPTMETPQILSETIGEFVDRCATLQ